MMQKRLAITCILNQGNYLSTDFIHEQDQSWIIQNPNQQSLWTTSGYIIHELQIIV